MPCTLVSCLYKSILAVYLLTFVSNQILNFMRRQVLFVGLICVAFLVNAQEEKTIDLDEVTIQASSIIRKKDRQLIFPSKDQVRRSMDGLDLTRRMSLPRLWVDPNTKSISMANGNVQLRINGVLASSLEVAALSPEDINGWNITITPACDMGKESISSWII